MDELCVVSTVEKVVSVLDPDELCSVDVLEELFGFSLETPLVE